MATDTERRDLASRFGIDVQLLLSKHSIRQLLRYGVLGVVTNVLGLLLYLGVVALGVEPKIAMTVLYCTGVAISFFGNKNWTFSHDGHALQSSLRYAVAYLFGYLMNYAILYVFVDRLHYSHAYVQAVSIFVVAAFLFLAFKFFVFAGASARGRC